MSITEPSEGMALARFAYEAGHLSRIPRTGWQLAGVARVESVAEHSFRVGVIAYIIAHMERCDAEHAAVLGLFHDLSEARTGDLNSVAKRYVSNTDPQKIAADQVEGLEPWLGAHIVDLVEEFESAKRADYTPEARCARDADKIECLLVAREYSESGHKQLQPWIDTMLSAVRTTSGLELARNALVVAPGDWWYDTVSSYGIVQ